MNTAAERHLALAAKYLNRGETYYRRAAAEIVAAKEGDPTLSNAQIGERFGRSHKWVGQLVAWATSGKSTSTPWEGERSTATLNRMATKKVLREAPLEEVERIVSELPPERVSKLAAATGNAYHKARQDERETPLDRERIERERAADEMKSAVSRSTAGFAALGIVGHIEQATEELAELVGSHALTPEIWKPIETALAALLTEAEVARALIGFDKEVVR